MSKVQRIPGFFKWVFSAFLVCTVAHTCTSTTTATADAFQDIKNENFDKQKSKITISKIKSFIIKKRKLNQKRNEFQLFEQIGSGGSGKVYRATTSQDKIIAVKITKSKDDKLSDFKCKKLMSFDHPNVLKTYFIHDLPFTSIIESFSSNKKNDGINSYSSLLLSLELDELESIEDPSITSYDDTCKCIGMEYCNLGTLANSQTKHILNIKNIIKNDSTTDNSINKHLALNNENEILSILKDIVQGMYYLHNIGIVHGDLKLDNILVKSCHGQSEPFQCKIGDFGSIKMCKNDQIIKNKMYITANYAPPEIFIKNIYTQKSDVYAFGFLIWELITGKRAFKNLKTHEIIFRTMHGDRPMMPDSMPKLYSNLINQCWHHDLNERPSFDQILEQINNRIAYIKNRENRNHLELNKIKNSKKLKIFKNKIFK